jgi:hypothetical protein
LALADRYRYHLLNLLHHCVKQKEMKWTPSDFLAQEELTMEELENVFDFLGENIKR